VHDHQVCCCFFFYVRGFVHMNTCTIMCTLVSTETEQSGRKPFCIIIVVPVTMSTNQTILSQFGVYQSRTDKNIEQAMNEVV